MRNIKITKAFTAIDVSEELTRDDQIYLEETEEMERWATSQSIYVTFTIAVIVLIGMGYSLIQLIHSIFN